MSSTDKTLEFLRSKAASLPRVPGVYIMENKSGDVIYVGKSRSLKDRVSQYFHGSHDIKTAKMASNVSNFRYIICDTEMDALIVENDLIKQYTPKYNILLKDSKSYPYIKITDGEYPRVVMTRKRTGKGKYFGPYSGTTVIYEIISMLERTLGIPSCKRTFPRDIGKGRPCVNYQIGRCCGVCRGDVTREDYAYIISCAEKVLKGGVKEVVASLEERMYKAAAEERFEDAARCRDSIASLKKLGGKQKRGVVLPSGGEYDVIALGESDFQLCSAVFYVRDGIISDSEQFIFGHDEITGFRTANETDQIRKTDGNEEYGAAPVASLCSEDADFPFSVFIINLYSGREYIPGEILLSFEMPQAERELVGEYLSKRAGHRVTLKTPVRGELRKLCLMAQNDAARHAESRRKRADATEKILVSLASALKLEVIPERIECYDISNLGDEHITAGMIVTSGGVFKKSDYRYFRIKSTRTADDYASMREAMERRFSELSGDDESFSVLPDLILVDGGMTHTAAVREVAARYGVDVPVFGMVKDSYHKTRSLVSDCEEISIAKDASLFRFIYKLQEEVHRFTISRMKAAKLKTLKTSEFEKIPGIGPAKAKILLASSVDVDVKNASAEELSSIRGISERDALSIAEYFRREREGAPDENNNGQRKGNES
ncbi:MAG: excinuclease ABC subunit UvrC [Clostridia bacterium]|nr:excinuclease ABC subunit UvrC [Clostridia bacterium]